MGLRIMRKDSRGPISSSTTSMVPCWAILNSQNGNLYHLPFIRILDFSANFMPPGIPTSNDIIS
jgi:hypothetical protein